jgi:hypothetical protein
MPAHVALQSKRPTPSLPWKPQISHINYNGSITMTTNMQSDTSSLKFGYVVNVDTFVQGGQLSARAMITLLFYTSSCSSSLQGLRPLELFRGWTQLVQTISFVVFLNSALLEVCNWKLFSVISREYLEQSHPSTFLPSVCAPATHHPSSAEEKNPCCCS